MHWHRGQCLQLLVPDYVAGLRVHFITLFAFLNTNTLISRDIKNDTNFFRHHHHSSSCCAISMDIPDPFSPPLPIVYCFRQGFKTTFRIATELLYVGSSWSSMWRFPQEYITYELVPTSPAVSRISCSSNLDSFRDGW